jgi:hypothetical protein
VIPLTLHLDCEQSPLVSAVDSKLVVGDGTVTDIGLLRHGTVSGKATVAVVVTLDGGNKIIGQTTWALLRTAFAGLAASPIVAEEVIDP